MDGDQWIIIRIYHIVIKGSGRLQTLYLKYFNFASHDKNNFADVMKLSLKGRDSKIGIPSFFMSLTVQLLMESKCPWTTIPRLGRI